MSAACSASVGGGGPEDAPLALDQPWTLAANSQSVIASTSRGVKPRTAPVP